jgi:hypothetical protein
VQIAHEMRAETGRQTRATRPILGMVEVDQRLPKAKTAPERLQKIRKW